MNPYREEKKSFDWAFKWAGSDNFMDAMMPVEEDPDFPRLSPVESDNEPLASLPPTPQPRQPSPVSSASSYGSMRPPPTSKRVYSTTFGRGPTTSNIGFRFDNRPQPATLLPPAPAPQVAEDSSSSSESDEEEEELPVPEPVARAASREEEVASPTKRARTTAPRFSLRTVAKPAQPPPGVKIYKGLLHATPRQQMLSTEDIDDIIGSRAPPPLPPAPEDSNSSEDEVERIELPPDLPPVDRTQLVNTFVSAVAMTPQQINNTIGYTRATQTTAANLSNLYGIASADRVSVRMPLATADQVAVRFVPLKSDRFLVFNRKSFLPENLRKTPQWGTETKESIEVPQKNPLNHAPQMCFLMEINEGYTAQQAAGACMALFVASVAHMGTRIFDIWYSEQRHSICIVAERVRRPTDKELRDVGLKTGIYMLVKHAECVGLFNPEATLNDLAFTQAGRLVYTRWKGAMNILS